MMVEVMLNQDSILDFSKMSTYFKYLPFEISLLDFCVHFCLQNGHVPTAKELYLHLALNDDSYK